MWKVKLPKKNNAFSELTTALTLADGTTKYPMTKQQEKDIKDIYKEYERAKGVPNTKLLCSSFDAAFLEAIKSGYNEVQKGRRLTDLRDRLLLNAGLCPCCGIVVADELDHHIPKSKYKALSIYSSNLVPICHICNKRKNAVTGSDPDERFIHSYYDEVPEDAQFLYATVQLVGKKLVVEFEIKKIPELSVQLYKQLDYQIKRVNLNQRLKKELNLFMDPLAYAIKLTFETSGKEAVRLLLKGTANDLKQKHGINHWRSAATHALADHDKFCDGGFYKPLSLPPRR